MICRGIVVALGAAAAALCAAPGGAPAAYADDDQLLDISGLRGPIGEPTNVHTIDGSPFFEYHQESDLYNVVSGGQFTDTHSFFEAPYQPFGLWMMDTQDVISNSTYVGLENGAIEDNTGLYAQGLTGVTELLGNDYVNNPGIATSDLVTLLGGTFTLWDIPADVTPGADAIAALF
jgi:hypothetical protein